MLVALPRHRRGTGARPSTASSTTAALLLLLGLGTTAGIVAMTVVLWPALRRAGIRACTGSFDIAQPRRAQGRRRCRVGRSATWSPTRSRCSPCSLLATRARRGVRLHVRVRVLPASARAVRGVDHDHLHPRPRVWLASVRLRPLPGAVHARAFASWRWSIVPVSRRTRLCWPDR